MRIKNQMQNRINRKQQGFSLIELVIVIVILGLLAATAIPRFLNVTDDAEDASLEGVTGGLATAVGFVRAQWEVDGRNNSNVVLDGTTLSLDKRFGYPTGMVTSGSDSGNGNTSATDMTDASCQEVFKYVLQSAPKNVIYTADARKARYTVRVLDGSGGTAVDINGATVTNLDLCVYHQVASLALNTSTGIATPPPALKVGSGIIYNAATGSVVTFTNN